jgi:hypothetical protein
VGAEKAGTCSSSLEREEEEELAEPERALKLSTCCAQATWVGLPTRRCGACTRAEL